ncbi:MAG: DUF4143 domain-containing protein [Marinilabiliales bacterium]|nr:MAG: DUF4143 domain-containing protein [Marinilabiliales bacterium]
MFKRDLLTDLEKWARSPLRKPLILRGARQVGKTSLVKMFAENYDHFIHLNLDKKEDQNLFLHELDIHRLFEIICLHKQIKSIDGDVLLFIDEIQNSPNAIAALRYFYEEKNDIHVIAAGSLLETIFSRNISFPVGRVEYLPVRPCSFSEYIRITGNERSLELLDTVPFPEYGHDHLIRQFNNYTIIGGMPEIINTYLRTNSFLGLNKIYNSLFVSYTDDVEKYAPNLTMANVMRHIIKHSFIEASTRIKFQGFGNSPYRNREIGEAFKMLERSFLINLVYPATNTQLPMMANYRRSPKLQLVDTGMVNYFSGIQGELITVNDLNDSYKGRIAEHITGQELLTLADSVLYKLNYWTRENKDASAEVDFVWQHQNKIIPIEVKSGKAGKLRSLHQFVDRAPHNFALRIYSGKFSVENAVTIAGKKYKLINIPFYLIHKLPKYLEYCIGD